MRTPTFSMATKAIITQHGALCLQRLLLHFIKGGQKEQINPKIRTVSDYSRTPHFTLLPGNFPGHCSLVLLADKHTAHGTSLSPRLWMPSQRFLVIGKQLWAAALYHFSKVLYHLQKLNLGNCQCFFPPSSHVYITWAH